MERNVMRNFLGTLIGAAIDRRDGDSGIKGALLGSLAEGAIKKAGPLALTFAVGWGAFRLVRRGMGASRREAGPA
jgi:hypothetical protein